MNQPKIVSRDEWRAAREELLVKEKELTHAHDALNAERRRLPMVRVLLPFNSAVARANLPAGLRGSGRADSKKSRACRRGEDHILGLAPPSSSRSSSDVGPVRLSSG